MTTSDIVYSTMKSVLKRKMESDDNERPAKALKTFLQKKVTPGFTYTLGGEHVLSKVSCMFTLLLASSAKSEAEKNGRKRIKGKDILASLKTFQLERFLQKIDETIPAQSLETPNNGNQSENGEKSSHTGMPSAPNNDDVITIDSDSGDEIVADNSDEDADSEHSGDSIEMEWSDSDNEENCDSEGSDSSVEICETSIINNESQTVTADVGANNVGNKEIHDNLEDKSASSSELGNKDINTGETENRNLENNSSSSSEDNINHGNTKLAATEHIANDVGDGNKVSDLSGITTEKKDDANNCAENNSSVNESDAATKETANIADSLENVNESEQSSLDTKVSSNDHTALPTDHSQPEINPKNVNDEVETSDLEDKNTS